MNALYPLLIFIGIGAGILIAGLLMWHILMAIVRLVLAWYLPHAIDLLLERLTAATRARAPWEPVLRSLRLSLPWPWPWRLERAASQLSAGLSPADLLRTGSLLPKALRVQAAQALSQGPEAFALWGTSVRSRAGNSGKLVQQASALLAEIAAVGLVTYFMIDVIFPKFEQVMRELHISSPPLLMVATWLQHYGWAVVSLVLVTAIALAAFALALMWQRKRRIAAAYLLLNGSQARLPEAALHSGGSDSGSPHTFADICAANGWQADSPLALTRAVQRAELRRQRLAAWLPAVVAAVVPLVIALPVGVLVLGTMQMLLSILYQIETPS